MCYSTQVIGLAYVTYMPTISTNLDQVFARDPGGPGAMVAQAANQRACSRFIEAARWQLSEII